MAGLLDPKSRVVDAILTSAGKSQAFSGGLRIRYVTFSDAGSKYQGDSNDIVIASSASLGLESFSTMWDNVVVETDESGYMLSFSGNDVTVTPDGKLIVSGVIENPSDATSYYVSSSLQSLENLQIIASSEKSVNDPGLSAYPKSHTFSVKEGLPFNGEPHVSSIDDVESFFADKRLSNLPNFKFLPPVQRSQAVSTPSIPLGNFQDLSETNNYANSDALVSLENLEGVSFELSAFTDRHTIAMQVFEEVSGTINKLDVIPYGAVGFSPEGGRSYMYFAGKVFDDGFDTPTYVNIFTMVIE
jgi:hypothetical protein